MVKTEPSSLPEGKVKIQLEHDGSILEVDEDDVEKVNGSWNLFPFRSSYGQIVARCSSIPVNILYTHSRGGTKN